MAELVLLPEATHPRYEEGDILCAFSDARIGEVHASHICHPSQHGFNSEGLRERGTLLERFNELGYRYRFLRVTSTFIIREDLRDPSEDIKVFGLRPNPEGEAIDVRAFLAERVRDPKHLVFGTPSNEVWYGGQWTLRVEELWGEIESRTAFRRADHLRWPLTPYERKRFLGVAVSEFDPNWDGPLTDGDPEQPTVLKRRGFRVDWKGMILPHLGGRYSEDDILDHSKEKEIRDLLFDARQVVVQKAVE